MSDRPNILVILNDDMGFSDIGCYGGECQTPNLDSLAAGGLRYTQFYNTPRCSPSRASLLTGLHPHQVGVGILTAYDGPDGYEGNLNKNGVTMAELLKSAGYRTYMSGKWHLVRNDFVYDKENDTWPCKRGFDHHFGTLCGAGNFYSPRVIERDGEIIEDQVREDPDFFYTDAISDNAVAYINEHFRDHGDKPFFQYVAYTAPHWPLHAKDEDIAKYKGRFADGWDSLRTQRLQRLVDMGILDESWAMTPRDPGVEAWEDAENKQWQQRRMEVYAAQIDCMDQGIGRIIDALKRNGQLDNTFIVFMSDNGGCAEVIQGEWGRNMADSLSGSGHTTPDGRAVQYGNDPEYMPGDESTYQSYGVEWANLSNTPFRMYKHWTHEGGISTPFIVHWPRGFKASGELRTQPAQLVDIMATVVDITGAEYPTNYNGHDILPMEGHTLTGTFEDKDRDVTLFWEHEGNAAVRQGKWKLVLNFTGNPSACPDYTPPCERGSWELYDIEADRTELNNLAGEYPEIVADMVEQYQRWADRCCVIPRDKVLAAGKKWREQNGQGKS